MSVQNCLGVVLGTVQDGGVPQLGCNCGNCSRAFTNKKHILTVASIGIINPNTGKSYLIDATPNIIEQLALFHDASLQVVSPVIVNKKPKTKSLAWLGGIFLTHAHMGHYLGLPHLGKESCNVRSIPVYATSEMIKFLSKNQPFSDLINNHNIILQNITPGEVCLDEPGLSITPIGVQHRHEHSDTVGFVFKSIKKELLYIPDIDKLTDDILEMISQVDIAIIDGTFFDKTEIPSNRKYNEIPHPLIKDSMHLLTDLVKNTKIIFTHFNHTNPVIDPKSEAVSVLKKNGFGIAQTSQKVRL
jgi:pyrroloquinoline quinone biosynthesis protein B